jgi:hypothetical protein
VTSARTYVDRSGQWASAHRVEIVAVVLALLPLVVSAIVLLVSVGNDYHPIGDNALIELRTRDVGREPVLIGLYSRDGWSHPGPALFYVLALPYRLLGSTSIALRVGALLLNGAAIVGMAFIARRRGGVPVMLLTLFGATLVVRTLSADYVRDPWNCFITVLPYGLLLFLTWAMVSGGLWALPAGVAVTTFLAQTHVQYVPLAVPLLALGGVVLGWRMVRSGRARPFLIGAALSLALLAVLWLPPLVQEVDADRGNITRTVDWFQHSGEEPHTIGDGLKIVAAQFGAAPEWLTWERDREFITGETIFLRDWPVPWLLLVVAGAVYVAWRRREHEALRLAGVLVVASVVGVIALSRVTGIMYAYRLQWTWLIAMTAAVLVGWMAWKLIEQRAPQAPTRVLVPLVLVGTAIASGASVVSALRAGTPEEPETSVVETLMAQAEPVLADGDGAVVMQRPDAYLGPAVLLALERAGFPARVEDDAVSRFGDGEQRIHHRGPVRASLQLAVDDAFDDAVRRSDLELIAYWGTLSVSERAEVVADIGARQADLDAKRAAGQLDAREHFARSKELQRLLRPQAGFGSTAVGIFRERPA